MGKETDGVPPAASPTADLSSAIERLKDALEILDCVGVPLACAYVDLALSMCRQELSKRAQTGSLPREP